MPKKTPKKTSPKASPEKADLTADQTPVADKEPRKRELKAKLEGNAVFMRGLGWTFGIFGLIASLPFISSFVEAVVWPIIKLPFWYLGLTNWPFGYSGGLTNAFTSLIFGTSTTPGIPVAFVQGLLPPFMAPFAIWVLIGLPLALLAYQYAYVNGNERLFAPKPPPLTGDEDKDKNNPIVRDRNRAKGEPDTASKPDSSNEKQATKDDTEEKQAPKEEQQPSVISANDKSLEERLKTSEATVKKLEKQVKALKTKGQTSSKDAEATKKRAPQKGSANAIVPGLNRTRAQAKAAAQAQKADVEAPKPAAKRKRRK